MRIQAVLYSFGSLCKNRERRERILNFLFCFVLFPMKYKIEILALADLQSTFWALHAVQQTVGFIDLQARRLLGREPLLVTCIKRSSGTSALFST